MRAKAAAKERAIRLRVDERRSINEIEAATGVPRSTLSLWLRPYPLSENERATRRVINHRGGVPAPAASKPSKFYEAVADRVLSRQDKGRIAEAAVAFRLALHGFVVYSSVFEGDKADFVVQSAYPDAVSVLAPSRPFSKIQVKWVTQGKFGRPLINLQCANKSRRYDLEDFDFIVGYDLRADTAYVYGAGEVAHLRVAVSVSDEAAERWDKLRGEMP